MVDLISRVFYVELENLVRCSCTLESELEYDYTRTCCSGTVVLCEFSSDEKDKVIDRVVQFYIGDCIVRV